MLPEQKTIDEIFGIVQRLNQRERKKINWWVELKHFNSSLSFLGFCFPSILLSIAFVLGYIDHVLGKFSVLGIIGLILIFIMYICIYLDQFRTIAKDYRESLSKMVGYTMEQAGKDVQHVNDFYKQEIHSLKYVLVQLKAERAARERRIGLMVGALEKVGIIPALIAVMAFLIRPEISKYPAGLLSFMIAAILVLYGGSFVDNYQMISRLDRIIALIEMVIENKKSSQTAPSLSNGSQLLPLGSDGNPLL